jgi:catechol 2,3-dioxygenase-like lactoylglutathione lyase family enzyme
MNVKVYSIEEDHFQGGHPSMNILSILQRVYLAPERFHNAITFYEQLFQVKEGLRFDYTEKGLQLSQVGPFLLIAGDEQHLAPFIATTATFVVDSLDEWLAFLLPQGSLLLDGPHEVPTGQNMLIQHPDGVRIEYVEHTQEKVASANTL